MGNVVLITGINGFIGQSLTKTLSREGTAIIGVDLHDEASASLKGYQNVKYIKMDLTDEANVERLKMYNPSIISHLAGQLPKTESFSDHKNLFSANLKATFNLLELSRVCNSHFIFPSSGLVYGNQKNPFHEEMKCVSNDFYAFTKHIAEQQVEYFARIFGITYTIFRMSVLYGPYQKNSMLIPSLINTLLDRKEFKMTLGEQYRDFLYIDDCIDGFIRGMESRITGTYNLSSGKALKIVDVARKVENIIGIEGLLKIGALEYRKNESWEYCLSPQKFIAISGWNDNVSIDDGLMRTVEWYKKEKKAEYALMA